MPRTSIIFYQETANDVPVLDWLQKLRRSGDRAYETCVAAIERLAAFGHELRRPLADILRDGIYELRIRKGRVNYRILYFFHGRNLAILGHALTKEDDVPKAEIERAPGERRPLRPIRTHILTRKRSKHNHGEDQERIEHLSSGHRKQRIG